MSSWNYPLTDVAQVCETFCGEGVQNASRDLREIEMGEGISEVRKGDAALQDITVVCGSKG